MERIKYESIPRMFGEYVCKTPCPYGKGMVRTAMVGSVYCESDCPHFLGDEKEGKDKIVLCQFTEKPIKAKPFEKSKIAEIAKAEKAALWAESPDEK